MLDKKKTSITQLLVFYFVELPEKSSGQAVNSVLASIS